MQPSPFRPGGIIVPLALAVQPWQATQLVLRVNGVGLVLAEVLWESTST